MLPPAFGGDEPQDLGRGQAYLGSRGPFSVSIVELAPLERGVPAKTGQFDDTVRLDATEDELRFVGPALHRMRAGRAAPAPLFQQPYDQFLHVFRQCGAVMGQAEDLSPYQLRHGGASHDLLFKRRQRSEVKARGRW